MISLLISLSKCLNDLKNEILAGHDIVNDKCVRICECIEYVLIAGRASKRKKRSFFVEYEYCGEDTQATLYKHCLDLLLLDSFILTHVTLPSVSSSTFLGHYAAARLIACCGALHLLAGLVTQGKQWVLANKKIITDSISNVLEDFINPSLDTSARMALIPTILPSFHILILLFRCYSFRLIDEMRMVNIIPSFASACSFLHDLQVSLRQDPSIQVWRVLQLSLHILLSLSDTILQSYLPIFSSLVTLCLMKANYAETPSFPSSLIDECSSSLLNNQPVNLLDQSMKEADSTCLFDDKDLAFFSSLELLASHYNTPHSYTLSLTASSLFSRIFNVLLDVFPRLFHLSNEEDRYELLAFIRNRIASSHHQRLIPNLLSLLWYLIRSIYVHKNVLSLARWQITLTDLLKSYIGDSDERVRVLAGESLAWLTVRCEPEMQTRIVNYLQSQLRTESNPLIVSGCMFTITVLTRCGDSTLQHILQPKLIRILLHEGAEFTEPTRWWSLHCVMLIHGGKKLNLATIRWITHIAMSQVLVDGCGATEKERTYVSTTVLKLILCVLQNGASLELQTLTTVIADLLNVTKWVIC